VPVNNGVIFCSQKCKSKFYVDRRRKELKIISVQYKGGKCYICDYDKCINALEFHHLDASEKDFSIGADGYTRSWDKVKSELDKCVMLCCRCHRECHAGDHVEVLAQYLKELKGGAHIYTLDETMVNRQKHTKQQNMLSRQRNCLACGEIFDPERTKKKFCSTECRVKSRAPKSGRYRKVLNRPSQSELEDMLRTMSYCAVGRKYGVSDNAVRKWERAYKNRV